MNLKKGGADFAKFAIKTGEEYTGRCIEMWETVPNTDPWYGLYQEALKGLYNHEYGKRYVERRARLLRYASERNEGSAAGDDRHQQAAGSGSPQDQ